MPTDTEKNGMTKLAVRPFQMGLRAIVNVKAILRRTRRVVVLGSLRPAPLHAIVCQALLPLVSNLKHKCYVR